MLAERKTFFFKYAIMDISISCLPYVNMKCYALYSYVSLTKYIHLNLTMFSLLVHKAHI